MNIDKRLSLWGVAAVAIVSGAALLTSPGVAQEQAVYVTGADVRPAHLYGHPLDTVLRMKVAYKALKDNNWDSTKVPFELLTYPDQLMDEQPHKRNLRATGFCLPNLDLYSDVALYCDTYFRTNLTVYRTRSVSRPEGFFLVMFKDGTLSKIDPADVRMYPHPTIPDGTVPVFPGMKVYSPDLPRMIYYQ